MLNVAAYCILISWPRLHTLVSMLIKICQHIRAFLAHHTTFLDKLFIFLVIISLVCGTSFILINQWSIGYDTPSFFATKVAAFTWARAALLVLFSLLFLFYSMFIREESPRSSAFLWGLGLFSWVFLSNVLMVNGVQSAPFP